MKTYSTIVVPPELKAKMDSVKVHPRETYADLIERLISSMPSMHPNIDVPVA